MAGFEDLMYQVIEKDLCSRCGTCSGICPRIEIDETPHLIDRCTQCGMCYTFCHRVGFPKTLVKKKLLTGNDSEFGMYEKTFSAKGKYEGHDGGVVTTLLNFLFHENMIDTAVVVCDDSWSPRIELVENCKKTTECRGLKYSVISMGRSIRDFGKRRVAFVGLPCQLESLRKIQLNDFYDLKIERIEVMNGLFCYENFNSGFLKYVDENVAKLEEVKRFDIKIVI